MTDIDPEFRSLVESADAQGLRTLLQNRPEVRSDLDSPAFGFDAPALVFAVGMSRRDVAEVLLEAGADIDAKSAWSGGPWSALHHAVSVKPEFVQFLLDHGATIDIHSAAGLGRLDLLRRFLDADPECVHLPGPDGQQPLHMAADVATVDFLLQRGARLDATCIDHESTPAQWAIGVRPEIARALLDRGARPDVFLAAALGDAALLEWLADDDARCLEARLGRAGYPPVAPGNIMDWGLGWWTDSGGGASPRRIGKVRGHRDFVATWDRLVPPWLRLLGLCECGDLDVVEALLAQDPELPGSIPRKHHRVLADRAWDGDVEGVRACLAAGLDPHVPGDHDSTPLDRAAFHGFAEVIRLLLAADPDPPLERTNEFGGTPLSALVYGAKEGWRDDGDHVAAARLLIEAGSQVSAWSVANATPELAELFRQFG